jgi:hypothetical protein
MSETGILDNSDILMQDKEIVEIGTIVQIHKQDYNKKLYIESKSTQRGM